MSTSPKIYLLKNAEGKFVSVEQTNVHFVTKMCYARYTKNQKEIEAKRIPYEVVLGCHLEIHVSTEEEFMDELASITTQAIIVGHYYKQLLENIDYNLPTISQINKNLRNSLRNSIQFLELTTAGFKEFEKSKEDTTYEVYGYFQEMIMQLSGVSLYQVNDLSVLIKALKKDSKSMLGIAKKVLNH